MIAINTGDVIRIGNSIVSKSDEFNQKVKEIYALVTQMLQEGDFAGEAAKKYEAQFMNDRPAMEKFGDELKRYGEILITSGNSYSALDEDLTSQIAGHRG